MQSTHASIAASCRLACDKVDFMFNWHSKKKENQKARERKNSREKERQREKENQHESNALRTRPPGSDFSKCVRSIDYSLDSKDKCMFSLPKCCFIARGSEKFPGKCPEQIGECRSLV